MSECSGYERSAHLYDLFDAKPNVAFFGRYAREAGEVLDIGAGTGRIAIPLAGQGIRVYSVEPSPAMRGVFENKLRGRFWSAGTDHACRGVCLVVCVGVCGSGSVSLGQL
jgi:SAM-dependent methyltransferase